ncbi:ankyrin repeat domain-containing protein [Chloropicon roscoffensis]|uniref:Ankyrin repeat domain-containing protein n=1 Tax=Chloropicon roscoffensis TaxID=1461544 RepID=A0AAX4P019_9CHLO
MARRAGEPTAKPAKVDEADEEEEEDPLVRRKEELVVALKEARSRGDARAERVARREMVTLCADFEAKNEKLLRRLPPELWQKILDENLHQNDLFALAMTCRFFREKQKDLGWKVETKVDDESRLLDLQKSGKMVPHTLGWFRWVCDTVEFLPGFKWPGYKVKGAVYEGELLHYAAFQGSVEILRWLMEEKGWELDRETGEWAGWGGSIEVFEYLVERGYEFDGDACAGAVRGGHLEALKFLRGLDPPCPWDESTCYLAAEGGHLDVLKWARSQTPPCPWDWRTSDYAAERGHLDVLMWARSQSPPCPWCEDTCAYAAEGGHLEVLKFARGQDPPCFWDERTCAGAAQEGHLEVLKWVRDQDPPCFWDENTCGAAAYWGHLEVLKWLRAEEPPCPWSRSGCRWDASENGHHHIINWIDQQEDESDLE